MNGGTRAWPRWALRACFAILLLRLLSLPLYPLLDRTESRYAEVAREMAASGDWVSPRLRGEPFWAKPPLATWCTAAGITVIGANELGARLPAWFAVILTLAVLWRCGRVVGGRALAGGASIAFMTAPLAVAMAGAVMTDPWLGLGCTTALLGLLLAIEAAESKRGAWTAAVVTAAGLAIATLAKGPIGLLFGGGPVFGLLLSPAGRTRLRGLPWLRVIGLTALLTVPWFLVAEQRTPGFLEYFFVGEHFHRFVDSDWSGDLYGGTHPRPPGIIWLYLIVALAPWAPAAAVMLRREGPRTLWRTMRTQPAWSVIGVAFCLPLLLFTFASSLLPTYIYPSVAPACLMLAAGLERHHAASRIVRCSPRHFPILGCVLCVPALLILALQPAERWVSGTQRDVLAGGPHEVVVYTRNIETIYSASFYTQGRATTALTTDAPAWATVRANPGSAVVVTKKRRMLMIPADVRERLRLVRDIDGLFQLWAYEGGG